MTKKSKRKKKIQPLLAFLFLASALILTLAVSSAFSSLSVFSFINDGYKIATTEHGWNLMLVNYEYAIPDDYDVELTKLANGEKVDSRIYPDLQKMFDDARARGLGLFVAEGYRTAAKQQKLLDDKIDAYRNEGYTDEDAEVQAKKWVAVPGTSEHQLGIAVDINADKDISKSEDVYKWLENNAHKYGFILRYPADKTEITGIDYEPWHFRYVGKDAAKEIYNNGICLEEYIDTL